MGPQRIVRRPLDADMHDTAREVTVTVEVPGLDRWQLELTITSDALAIRGEKQEETEDTTSDAYMLERRYGSFARTIPLPEWLDLDRAEARVDRGVLTVRFPKKPDSGRARWIPVGT